VEGNKDVCMYACMDMKDYYADIHSDDSDLDFKVRFLLNELHQ
jgi:hypothetical protein